MPSLLSMYLSGVEVLVVWMVSLEPKPGIGKDPSVEYYFLRVAASERGFAWQTAGGRF